MLDAMGLEVCAERVCRELVASCETAADKSTAAALGGWIVFEDECGQFMRLRSRTWGRRGITPVIRVRGGTGHVSVAGLACYRPGHRIRLIRWLHCYRGRKGRSQGVHLGQVPGPAYRCLAGTGLTLDQIEHPTDAKN
jgi:hypothetical protein